MRNWLLLLPALFVACSSAVSTTATPTPAPIPPRAIVSGTLQPWTDAEVDAALRRLGEFDLQTTLAVLDHAAGTRDRRLIAPFIELLRFRAPSELYNDIDGALTAITGVSFGNDWGLWNDWLARQDDVPLPKGFPIWKGELIAALVDPQFVRFFGENRETTLRVDLIQWGGVRVDGIPALANPDFVSPAEATYLVPGEPVFGVEINRDVRAYPLRILDWHEMANDVVGGVPVSLAYCTLCGTGILYETTVGGTVYDFGSSGLLYGSNKLMYDRQTDTLWNQLTGEPVSGPLVGSGIRLNVLPVVVTSWENWLADHPETRVLSIDTGYARDYSIGAAYGDYFASSETMFAPLRRSKALPDKAFVYALQIDGTPKAYPLVTLQDERVVNDTVAGREIVLVSEPDTQSRAVRVYERAGITFAPTERSAVVTDGAGGEWRVTEDALLGPDGQSLARVPGHISYWFGWFEFFPRTLLYGDES